MSARKRSRSTRSRTVSSSANPSRPPAASPESYAQQVHALRQWLLPNDWIFSAFTLHGNTKWTFPPFVWLALCWTWNEARGLTDAFSAAAGQCRQLGLNTLTTYPGFMLALVTWTERLIEVL